MTWHADAAVLGRYVDGSLDDAQAYSLEAHLLKCDVCREQVRRFTDAGRMLRTWQGVELTLDTPHPRSIERLLLAVGIPDHVGRVLAATPSLRASWLLAVSVALGFAVLAALQGRGGLLLFLIIAPLMPLAGVAAAYGPGIDPTYEIGVAAPMRSLRLLLIRATAVVGTTTALAAFAGLLIGDRAWSVAGWLLPGLGLTTASLALSTVISPLAAAGSVSVSWIVIVFLAGRIAQDQLAVFGLAGQLVFLTVAVTSFLLLVSRQEALERGGRGWPIRSFKPSR